MTKEINSEVMTAQTCASLLSLLRRKESPRVCNTLEITTESGFRWLLLKVRTAWHSSERKQEAVAFNTLLPLMWSKLSVSEQRKLVSDSVELFLAIKRTERNRYVVEALIQAVDDINCCPNVFRQTLLERACGGSGVVDFGIAKALIRAGHSLDRPARAGVSPRQALENLYARRRGLYEKCRSLFQITDEKLMLAPALSRKIRTPNA